MSASGRRAVDRSWAMGRVSCRQLLRQKPDRQTATSRLLAYEVLLIGLGHALRRLSDAAADGGFSVGAEGPELTGDHVAVLHLQDGDVVGAGLLHRDLVEPLL